MRVAYNLSEAQAAALVKRADAYSMKESQMNELDRAEAEWGKRWETCASIVANTRLSTCSDLRSAVANLGYSECEETFTIMGKKHPEFTVDQSDALREKRDAACAKEVAEDERQKALDVQLAHLQGSTSEQVRAFIATNKDYHDPQAPRALLQKLLADEWRKIAASKDADAMRAFAKTNPDYAGLDGARPVIADQENRDAVAAKLSAMLENPPAEVEAQARILAEAFKALGEGSSSKPALRRGACLVSAGVFLKNGGLDAVATTILNNIETTDEWPCTQDQSNAFLQAYAKDFDERHKTIDGLNFDEMNQDLSEIGDWLSLAKAKGFKKSALTLSASSAKLRRALNAETARQEREQRQARREEDKLLKKKVCAMSCIRDRDVEYKCAERYNTLRMRGGMGESLCQQEGWCACARSCGLKNEPINGWECK